MTVLSKNVALVIGINQYNNGIRSLSNAVGDAESVAQLLETQHGYDVRDRLLLDGAATKEAIVVQLDALKQLPEDSRVLIYFAGHGETKPGETPQLSGHLLPANADRKNADTLLSMSELITRLNQLPCRHLLLVLDCCFGGAIRWGLTAPYVWLAAETRMGTPTPSMLYEQAYSRYVQHPAWQIITSSSADERAQDGLGIREGGSDHSPFARAFIELLSANNSSFPSATLEGWLNENVLTATQMYAMLRNRVESQAIAEIRSAKRPYDQKQTPQIFNFPTRHGKGEYVFLRPGVTEDRLNLPPAPVLSVTENPFKALAFYESQNADVFFGRDALTKNLYDTAQSSPLTIVVGRSGSGKSSLVHAGLLGRFLLPAQAQGHCEVIGPIRLDQTMESSNKVALQGQALTTHIRAQMIEAPNKPIFVIIDQIEALAYDRAKEAHKTFLQDLSDALDTFPDQLHVIVTLRADYQDKFIATYSAGFGQAEQSTWRKHWTKDALFPITSLTANELRDVIIRPVLARTVFFDSETLVNDILSDALSFNRDTESPLPQLSFAMHEMFECLRNPSRNEILINLLSNPVGDDPRKGIVEACLARRELHPIHYEVIGKVQGVIRRSAEQCYLAQDAESRETMRRVLLRLVLSDEHQTVKRVTPLSELMYSSDDENDENKRKDAVLTSLYSSSLIVYRANENREPTVELAHNTLLNDWQQLKDWTKPTQSARYFYLRNQLTPAAANWSQARRQDARPGSSGLKRFVQKLLVRGAPNQALWYSHADLNAVADVANSKDNWLNGVEAEFVQQSVDYRRFLQRRVGVGAGVIILLLLVALGVTLRNLNIAQEQTTIAQREASVRATAEVLEKIRSDELATSVVNEQQANATKQAQTNALATSAVSAQRAKATEEAQADALATSVNAQATTIVDLQTSQNETRAQTGATEATIKAQSDPALSLLLAIEAVKTSRTAQAQTALQNAMALFPRLDGLGSIDGGGVDVATGVSGRFFTTIAGKNLFLWERTGEAQEGRYIERQHLRNWVWDYTAVALSPLNGLLAAGSQSGGLEFYVTSTNRDNGPTDIASPVLEGAQQSHFGDITALSFSPYTPMLASADNKGTVLLWNVRNPLTPTIAYEMDIAPQYDRGATAVAFSPRCGPSQGVTQPVSSCAIMLATGDSKGRVLVWNFNSRKPIETLTMTNAIAGLMFAPDGSALFVASGRSIQRYAASEIGNYAFVSSFPNVSYDHDNDVTRFELMCLRDYTIQTTKPCQTLYLISIDAGSKLTIWDPVSNVPVKLVQYQVDGMLRALAVDSERHKVFVGTTGRVDIFLLGSASTASERAGTTEGGSKGASNITIERACQIAPRNFTQEEWELYFPSRTPQPTCPDLPFFVASPVTTPTAPPAVATPAPENGQPVTTTGAQPVAPTTVFTASLDANASVPAAVANVRAPSLPKIAVEDVPPPTFSRTGRYVAVTDSCKFSSVASTDCTTAVVDLQAGTIITMLQTAGHANHNIFTMDETRALIGGDAQVQLIDLATGDLINTFYAYGSLGAVQFSHDERYLAVAGNFEGFGPGTTEGMRADFAVYLYELQTAKFVAKFSSTFPVRDLEFTPDDAKLLPGESSRYTLKFYWDLRTLERINYEDGDIARSTLENMSRPSTGREFTQHGAYELSVGNQVITISFVNTSDAHLPAALLLADEDAVRWAFFLPDGQHVLSLHESGDVHVWRLGFDPAGTLTGVQWVGKVMTGCYVSNKILASGNNLRVGCITKTGQINLVDIDLLLKTESMADPVPES